TRHCEWAPAVAQLDSATQGATGSTADPDRYVLLHAAWVDDHSAERVVGAVVGGLAAAERRAQGADGGVAAPVAIGLRRAQRLELRLQVADADPEHQAATTDAVERAVALGDVEGMVIGQHEHNRRQPERGGVGGDVTECGQWVPVTRPRPIHAVGGDGDMLAAREELVSKALGRLRHVDDVVDGSVELPSAVVAW